MCTHLPQEDPSYLGNLSRQYLVKYFYLRSRRHFLRCIESNLRFLELSINFGKGDINYLLRKVSYLHNIDIKNSNIKGQISLQEIIYLSQGKVSRDEASTWNRKYLELIFKHQVAIKLLMLLTE